MKMVLPLAVLGIAWHTAVVRAQPANSPSPIVADVLKLSRAKVDESVILSYVQASAHSASPSAAELLDLHAQGISSSVMLALLKPGQPAQPAPISAAPSPPAPAPSASGAGASPPAPAYADAAPTVYVPTVDYVSIAQPTYVGVGSVYYPASVYAYDDTYLGLGWGLGYGVGWGIGFGLSWGWGWYNCYPYYGYGYGCHYGYGYPAYGHGYHHGCGDAAYAHGGHPSDTKHAGNPNAAGVPQSGLRSELAKTAGAGRPPQGAAVGRPVSPAAAAGTAVARPGARPGGQASVTPGTSRPVSTTSRPASLASVGNRPVASQASSPPVGRQYASAAGQSARPPAAWAATGRTNPGSPPIARPTGQGAIQVASLARPTPTGTGVRPAPTYAGAVSRGMPSAGSTRVPGVAGGFSSPSRPSPSFARPSAPSSMAMRTTGFSGASSARGFSGAPAGFSGGSRGFSGGGARSGGFSGGSRGGGGGRR